MIQPVLMNFSGVYEEEKFYRKFSGELLSLRTLEGTNCYCTPEAEEQIKAWIEKYPVRGIHFLDSGNYHYVTKFWIDRMQVPFDLRASFLRKLGAGFTGTESVSAAGLCGWAAKSVRGGIAG